MSEAGNQRDENGWGVVFACFVSAVLLSGTLFGMGLSPIGYVPLHVIYLLALGTFVGFVAPRWQWVCWLATYVGLLIIYLYNADIASNSTAGLGPFLMLPVLCLLMFAGGAFGIYLRRKSRP